MAALTALVFNLQPLYSAHTTLVLPSTPDADVAESRGAAGASQTDPFVIRSHLAMIDDDGICREVIRHLGLENDPEFNQPSHLAEVIADVRGLFSRPETKTAAMRARERQDRVLQQYKSRLTAFNDGRSLAIELSFEAHDPDLAARIVNAHASSYIADQIAARQREFAIKVSWMESEVAKSARDVQDAEMNVQLHASVPGSEQKRGAFDASTLKFGQIIVNAKQVVYESLLNRYRILLANQQYLGSDIRVLSPALVPIKPKFPNKPLFLTMAAVMAALVGAAAAYLKDFFTDFANPVEAASHFGLDVLGVVNVPPRSLRGRRRRRRNAVFWEQIRSVRARFRFGSTEAVTVAVTSASAGEGKTLLALSLARAIAASGARTLLLDLDLRNPGRSCLSDSGTGCQGGLQSFLEGEADLSRAVARIEGSSNLYLLANSPVAGCNVDALAGPQLRTAMKTLKREFDVILIDTPPLLSFADARDIVSMADRTLFVSRAEGFSAHAFAEAIGLLKHYATEVETLVVSYRRAPPRAVCRRVREPAPSDELSRTPPLAAKQKRPARERLRRLPAMAALRSKQANSPA